MLVKIKFLGILGTIFGNDPIEVDINPDYEALHAKIHEIIADKYENPYVVLNNGLPLLKTATIREGDTFSIFMPISGGW